MKKIAIICLLLASLHTRGDVVIVEQTVVPRMPAQNTITKIKGNKFRKDFPNRISAIYDLDSGGSIRIDHQMKSFKRISRSQGEALTKILDKIGGPTPAAPPAMVDTGKTENVNGHETEVYTAAMPSATYTYWVAKDYPDYAAMNEETKKLREWSEAMNKEDNLSPDLSKLDGMVVKSERVSAGGEVTTITLISAKIQPLDDQEFQPPAGYTEVLSPGSAPSKQ